MHERVPCRVEQATVRSDRREELEDLIRTLFERRHHPLVAGTEKQWLATELVQLLRRHSTVYREELSAEMEGPLPFALGYFRMRDDQLELVSDEIPANVAPKVLVRLLSEFVRPGACFWFGEGKEAEGWCVEGVGVIAPCSPETAP